MIDRNVQSVIRQLSLREAVGYAKYGVTTERTDINLLGWLQHLQEELLDAAVYIERLKQEPRLQQVFVAKEKLNEGFFEGYLAE